MGFCGGGGVCFGLVFFFFFLGGGGCFLGKGIFLDGRLVVVVVCFVFEDIFLVGIGSDHVSQNIRQ